VRLGEVRCFHHGALRWQTKGIEERSTSIEKRRRQHYDGKAMGVLGFLFCCG
jgi:hypothetical protein